MSVELKVKREIDSNVADLIRGARNYLNNANIHVKRKDPKDNKSKEITDTKMRNLLNVAANASSGGGSCFVYTLPAWKRRMVME